jgi:tetratricopeptide (TPR) repeat protein
VKQSKTPSSFKIRFAICLALASAILAAFSTVLQCGFINYDDPPYVTENPVVRRGLTLQGLIWAFSSVHSSNWHPLTTLSHMLDCQVFGLNPTGPHAINLIFHIANSILLFLVLEKMTGAMWRSVLVAALFALHPLRVESVAWISERKDVLSGFFFLLGLLAYTRYANEFRIQGAKAKRFYGEALFYFALGLMSKPMLVTFPFVLLLLDFWPIRRLRTKSMSVEWRTSPNAAGRAALDLLKEKIPFFALSVASSIVTFCVQKKSGAVSSLQSLHLLDRFQNAAVAYLRYVGKIFWPTDLAVFYPAVHWRVWEVISGCLVLVVISLLVLVLMRKRPWWAIGWFWFLGTLIPVIGLVQVGSQSMADRYSYLPSIGIFIAITWGAAELLGSRPIGRFIGVAVAGVSIFVCAVLTWFQVQFWKDNHSLFSHALAVTTNNHIAHGQLAVWLDAENKLDESVVHLKEAIRLQPYAEFHSSLANVFIKQGKLDEALAECDRALRRRPEFSQAHNNRGVALEKKGQWLEAIQEYAAAVKSDPEYAEAFNNWGSTLARQRKFEEALPKFVAALKIKPDYAEASDNLGRVYFELRRYREAAVQYAAALRSSPKFAVAYRDLGELMGRQNQLPEAEKNYRLALRYAPDDFQAHFGLGMVLYRQGKIAETVVHWSEAIRLKPDWPDLLNNLAWLLATCSDDKIRNGADAVKFGEAACRLTTRPSATFLDTLAASYAAAGDFSKAIETAGQARGLFLAAGETNQARLAQERLDLYQSGKAFRSRE